MNYQLLVRSPPNTSAIETSQALLQAGHTIAQVFFHGDGVYHAQGQIPSEALDVATAWHALAQNHDFPLLVCISSAVKRGIYQDTQKDQANLAPGFEICGLGSFMEITTQVEGFMVL